MSQVAILINRWSERNRNAARELEHCAARLPGVTAYPLDGITGMIPALEQMAARGTRTIVLAGGDGTVQAALSAILNSTLFEQMPRLAVLHCGMTNIVAHDCGIPGAPAAALTRLLARLADGREEHLQRRVLSVEIDGRAPLHGFFLGAGLFHSAVQFSRQRIHALGAKRSTALALTIGAYLFKLLRDRDSEDGNIVHLRWQETGGGPGAAPLSLLVATTLERLTLGVYPFWGQGEGPFRVTTVSSPSQRLLGALPHALRSRERPWFDAAGYHSWRAHEMCFTLDRPMVFDGEILHPQLNARIRVHARHSATFVR